MKFLCRIGFSGGLLAMLSFVVVVCNGRATAATGATISDDSSSLFGVEVAAKSKPAIQYQYAGKNYEIQAIKPVRVSSSEFASYISLMPAFWDIHISNTSIGDFRVSSYDVGVNADPNKSGMVAGISMRANFDGYGAPPNEYRWVKVVVTDLPTHGSAGRPYVSTFSYPQTAGHLIHPFFENFSSTTGELPFDNATSRPLDAIAKTIDASPVHQFGWTAYLFLVDYVNDLSGDGDPTRRIIVYDGVKWGYTITANAAPKKST
jgi:hypothetical protein